MVQAKPAQPAQPAAAPAQEAAPPAGGHPPSRFSKKGRPAPGPAPAAAPAPAPGAQIGSPPGITSPQAGVTMEAKGKSAGGQKKCGRWTIDQLRQTDGIIPLQYGTNKFDSQKGMTKFGTPRNNTTPIKADNIVPLPEDVARLSDLELRLQSGTNRFASQKGFVAFGTGRDVVRESNPVDATDLAEMPEEKLLASHGIVRLQSGTNKYDSQKGMTGIGTNRRELTKMKDTKHPEYLCDVSIDQSTNPLQMGTNKFASQKLMLSFGTNRRELTKMVDTAHPDQSVEHPDPSTIPLQMGTNKFASQKGMTSFGQPRWETLNPLISRQERIGQGLIPSQMGSNQFASQKMMTNFGMPRDVKKHGTEVEGQELSLEDLIKSEGIIRSQAGWNRGDSQKGMTKFGTPRDVKGTHMKRLWELDFPEEAEPQGLDNL